MTDCQFEYEPSGQTTRCICRQCGRVDVDSAPAEKRRRNCTILAPAATDCPHRGPQTGTDPRVCCGSPPLPVYHCRHFSESVTLRRSQAGTDRLRDCLACPVPSFRAE